MLIVSWIVVSIAVLFGVYLAGDETVLCMETFKPVKSTFRYRFITGLMVTSLCLIMFSIALISVIVITASFVYLYRYYF